jgi:inhibitor of KinA
VRFRAASDQALLVYVGEEIGLPAHKRVLELLRALEAKPPSWLRNIQPAYCSLLVTFDLASVDHDEVEAALRRFEERAEALRPRKPRLVEIPVCYGGEFGPDLEDVARLHGLTPQQVIDCHCSQLYFAYFLGFAPGFAYLGDLPQTIATPRLETPRRLVPAGSVAIAGKQTAVYPFATPGGWRLLGRTPLKLFDSKRKSPALISIGDHVRFRAISRENYDKWERA